MNKVSVKTGDTVLVNSGKDSGKKGKVLAIKKSNNHVRVVVEGVNIVTKAKKARTAQERVNLLKLKLLLTFQMLMLFAQLAERQFVLNMQLMMAKKQEFAQNVEQFLTQNLLKKQKLKK